MAKKKKARAKPEKQFQNYQKDKREILKLVPKLRKVKKGCK
jgi:hypothetical protein